MITEQIVKTEQNTSFNNFLYNKTFSIANGVTTNAILFPPSQIKDIGVSWNPSKPIIEFTFEEQSAIENDTAIWMPWDGISLINKAARAVRVNNDTGDVVYVVITLRVSD